MNLEDQFRRAVRRAYVAGMHQGYGQDEITAEQISEWSSRFANGVFLVAPENVEFREGEQPSPLDEPPAPRRPVDHERDIESAYVLQNLGGIIEGVRRTLTKSARLTDEGLPYREHEKRVAESIRGMVEILGDVASMIKVEALRVEAREKGYE